MESQVFQAKLKNLRISPRKVRLVADAIRGRNVVEALDILELTFKRSATPLHKLVVSAASNAQQLSGLMQSQLVISRIEVGEGPTMKRFMPRAQGRATVIRKRTSHITIEVSSPISLTSDKKKVTTTSVKQGKNVHQEEDVVETSSMKDNASSKSSPDTTQNKSLKSKKQSSTGKKSPQDEKPVVKKTTSGKASSTKKK
jgi:large subunit ribosomal protein L22